MESGQEEIPKKRQRLEDVESSRVVKASTSGRGVIEKYVPAHLLKYLPSKDKPEGEEVINVDDDDDDVEKGEVVSGCEPSVP